MNHRVSYTAKTDGVTENLCGEDGRLRTVCGKPRKSRIDIEDGD